MKSKVIMKENPVTYVVVFEADDEVMKGLNQLAEEKRWSASQITGIGSFQKAVLGYFDRERKQYQEIHIDEQVEVLSLVGDISTYNDKPKIHIHVVIGKRDGSAHGGHLLEAKVWPTLELIVTENPVHLRRQFDPKAGLPLIKI